MAATVLFNISEHMHLKEAVTNLGTFFPLEGFEKISLKIKHSRRPYSRPIESPVKASSPYYAWFGNLLPTDIDTKTDTQIHTQVNFII